MTADPAKAPGPPRQRISPITFPSETPVLAKPRDDEPQVRRDAFRETSFALPLDLRWLNDAFTLQRKIVEQSYGSSFRNRRYASALIFWSRVYSAGLEARTLTARASYSAALPLLRAMMEWLGAEQAVVGDEQVEFEDWLRDAWSNNQEHHVTEIGMGQYMAGQQIAMAPETADAYRAVSELSRSHFGASALLSADGSHDKRFLVNWSDEAFHLGWAQLLIGWQIVIQDRQCRFAVGSGLFGVESEDRQEYQRLHRQTQSLLEDNRRCKATWIIDNGRQRLLIDNYRRQPSGAPKRILL
ncbi:MAG: hypothetical protein OXD50_05160 [Chloroflexi bacterium]|nr:hypothetical protein [Chloroflexota bacterium]